MTLQRNHYEILGVSPTATTDQIKKKYRELARKFHPDVVKDKALGQKIFTQVNQAYRVLGDPERRAQYDTTLRADRDASAPAPTGPAGRPAPAPPGPSVRRAGGQARPPGRPRGPPARGAAAPASGHPAQAPGRTPHSRPRPSTSCSETPTSR